MCKECSEESDLTDEELPRSEIVPNRRDFIRGVVRSLVLLPDDDDDMVDERESEIMRVFERWLRDSTWQPITDEVSDICFKTYIGRVSSHVLSAIERVGFTGHDNNLGMVLSTLNRVCLF
jgi:hypothetical protein